MIDTNIKITPEFIIEMIIRRRWLILVPLSLSLIIGICLLIVLPRVYEAKTLILIESQRVPQNYVQSIVTNDPGERINTISQQIMSRTNLEKIINDFNLFSENEYKDMYVEDKLKDLRKRINVNVIRGGGGAEAFELSFKSKDPQKVMSVANALATYVIDENLKVRESQAFGTSQFLESELEDARKRLEQFEENIKEYRKTNMGELPEQLDTNLRIIERLQSNLNNREQSLREAKIRLADLNAQASTREPVAISAGGDQRRPVGDAISLETLRAELEALRVRYTNKHPDILRLEKQIVDFEASEQKRESAANTQGSAQAISNRVPAQLRLQLTDVQREIQLAGSEIEELKAEIALYQRRIENTPKREQEFLNLRRDYQNIQASYDSLLNRKLEADIAVNMERKQKGEQFRIVDPAKYPEKPVEPNMKKIFLMAVIAGLGIGGGLAFLLEYINTSFRKPDEIETYFELPVLTAIPSLLQPKHIVIKRINNIASIAFSIVVFGLLAVFGIMSIRGPESMIATVKGLLGV